MDKLFLCTLNEKGEVEPIFRKNEVSLAARQKNILITNRTFANKTKYFVDYVIIPTVATALWHELSRLVHPETWKCLEPILAHEAEDFAKITFKTGWVLMRRIKNFRKF
jgi:hypothetical protein